MSDRSDVSDTPMKRICHSGFTLVELLVVVVIIGVMAMMLGPTFTTGSDIARVKTATRGVMQMSRYARTMAVLHQTPVALVFSADGTIRVEKVAVSNRRSAISSRQSEIGNGQLAIGDGQSAMGAGQDGVEGKAYVMADLEAEKSYAQVRFDVTLDDYDTDEPESAAKGLFEESEDDKSLEAGEGVKVVTAARVIYESNGRCLPFKVVVRAAVEEGGAALTVAVDRFGVARVLEDER